MKSNSISFLCSGVQVAICFKRVLSALTGQVLTRAEMELASVCRPSIPPTLFHIPIDTVLYISLVLFMIFGSIHDSIIVSSSFACFMSLQPVVRAHIPEVEPGTAVAPARREERGKKSSSVCSLQ